jgi:hypothetical protein
MSDYFHRDGRPAASYAEIQDEMSFPAKRVAIDHVGPAEISTVYLGFNHRFGDGPPLIFESMVFGGPLDQETRRYATELEARAGHAELLELARQEVPADVVALQQILATTEYENTWKQAQALYDAGIRVPKQEEVTGE